MTLQSKLIDIFKKEQHNLLAAVKIATAKPWKKQDADKQKYIENLLRKYEDVFESAKVHKSQLTELEVQVFKVRSKYSGINLFVANVILLIDDERSIRNSNNFTV